MCFRCVLRGLLLHLLTAIGYGNLYYQSEYKKRMSAMQQDGSVSKFEKGLNWENVDGVFLKK